MCVFSSHGPAEAGLYVVVTAAGRLKPASTSFIAVASRLKPAFTLFVAVADR
jgi:hypothetical protein